jgi:hypothetical protein
MSPGRRSLLARQLRRDPAAAHLGSWRIPRARVPPWAFREHATIVYITGHGVVRRLGRQLRPSSTPGSSYYNKWHLGRTARTPVRAGVLRWRTTSRAPPRPDWPRHQLGHHVRSTRFGNVVELDLRHLVLTGGTSSTALAGVSGARGHPATTGASSAVWRGPATGLVTPNFLGSANHYHRPRRAPGRPPSPIANPTGNVYPPGGEMTLICYNASGGAVTWTFASYKLA